MFHLSPSERSDYFRGLTPGAGLDLRGTRITRLLLGQLLDALRRDDGITELGGVRFEEATFEESADFTGVQFNGAAEFQDAEFRGLAMFDRAIFSSASFDRSTFRAAATFREAKFTSPMVFRRVDFGMDASFLSTSFLAHSSFQDCHFRYVANFTSAAFESLDMGWIRFSARALFHKAAFAGPVLFGPVVCAEEINFSGSRFEGQAAFALAAAAVDCRRARFESTLTLRLRYAEVDLRDAVLSAPTAVSAQAAPLPLFDDPMAEAPLAGRSPAVKVASVEGVDASHLVLTDTDLTHCRFIGAFHLDQIRLEGRTILPPVPQGLHWGSWPIRWSPRRTVAEEHHWRAQQAAQPALPPGQPQPAGTWHTGPHHGDLAHTPDPEDVVAVYRQLRKAFEDGKNEPGAADFYYGEMEMRRHDRVATPRGERALLHAYWLLSGYGLRASRAFTWLILAMLTTILLLMGFGLPQHSPPQEATGVVPAGGGRVTFTIDKDDPQNPTGNRFTGERLDKALTATLNSVVFRSSGQDLTTAGTYIEMTSRLLEPALLALAVLAIRGRIKR
ncbi:pentapeptide repeat-containing protein [Streptomyces sp. NPDC051639]|uniref:pentapeptide repeat-containing protein n=1 Tax=Streptomyces sp. NPDC051639 TaxID=3155671 RepID=UPI0034426933